MGEQPDVGIVPKIQLSDETSPSSSSRRAILLAHRGAKLSRRLVAVEATSVVQVFPYDRVRSWLEGRSRGCLGIG